MGATLREIETFDGFSPDVVTWLRYAAHAVHNKLSRTQYGETTWRARTWMPFQTQRLSACPHKAVAFSSPMQSAATAPGRCTLCTERGPRGGRDGTRRSEIRFGYRTSLQLRNCSG